jgi:enoyl-CoA hydratase
MGDLVSYTPTDTFATVAMDDGKVNALSTTMLSELNGAFDQAESDRLAVLFTGKEGMFSAGFDLKTLRGGGAGAVEMLRGGFALAVRLLTFPTPVVIGCTGHAIAMGSFLLMSADYRIGASGAFRIGANEVAIGLTVPAAAIELCRARLNPSYFDRAVITAEMFDPEGAVAAGFLDKVVPATDHAAAAQETARTLASLDGTAHRGTKLRAREPSLHSIRQGIEEDDAFYRTLA